MPAGTIALTNNSATVTGSGTSFTTELKVNDFVASTVGGVAYTLGVKSIESNTSLTLMEIYTGPSASGQSWTPVPYGTMAAITAQLAAQVTYAIRGLNLDKANWQQVFTAPGNIIVSLPDGTSWQGPSWAYMTTQFAGKANTSDVLTKADNLNSLTDKATARTNLGLGELSTLNGPLAINKGGTGSATPFGTAANTFAQGNDSRLNTVNNKSGGAITSSVTINAGPFICNTGNMVSRANRNGSSGATTQAGWFQSMFNGTNAQFSSFMEEQVGINLYGVQTLGDGSIFRRWHYAIDGNAYATNGNWVNGSDSILKNDIKPVPNALESVLGWRGASWEWKDKSRTKRGLGLIADDVEKTFPDAISHFSTTIDGETFDNVRAIDPGSIAAAYHTEAIKSLFSLVELALVDPDKALASIDSIKAAIDPDSGS